jgi:hypothetical protein
MYVPAPVLCVCVISLLGVILNIHDSRKWKKQKNLIFTSFQISFFPSSSPPSLSHFIPRELMEKKKFSEDEMKTIQMKRGDFFS